MNRVFEIIDFLRGRERTTTGELAAHLGVSERTVRRDLIRLRELDAEVLTEPGRRGGLRLQRGALLPALRFTDDEVMVLALGLRQAQVTGDPRQIRAAQSAFRRLEHVLSGQLGQQIEAVLTSLGTSDGPVPKTEQIDSSTFLALSQAVSRRERLRIRYRTSDDHVTHREFDPYGIVQAVDHWYVVGYCHLRLAVRTFRIDRLEVQKHLPVTFSPPADFDAVETVHQAVARTPAPDAVTCLLWVQASQEEIRVWLPTYRAQLKLECQGVMISLRAEPKRFRQVALEALHFGHPVRILGPPAFQQTFANIAAQAAALASGEQVRW